MTHKFHSSILRAYDIRGIYNQTLFDNDAYFVGRCFAKILHQNIRFVMPDVKVFRAERLFNMQHYYGPFNLFNKPIPRPS